MSNFTEAQLQGFIEEANHHGVAAAARMVEVISGDQALGQELAVAYQVIKQHEAQGVKVTERRTK